MLKLLEKSCKARGLNSFFEISQHEIKAKNGVLNNVLQPTFKWLKRNTQTTKGVVIVPNLNDSEWFKLGLKLVIEVLKLQEQSMVESIAVSLTTQLGSESTTDILTAAVFQLAETDPDICRWSWRTFSHLNFHLDLKEEILMFATKKLIGRGFILGQHFSLTGTGGIVMTKSAQAAFREATTASDWIFLEEILQAE